MMNYHMYVVLILVLLINIIVKNISEARISLNIVNYGVLLCGTNTHTADLVVAITISQTGMNRNICKRSPKNSTEFIMNVNNNSLQNISAILDSKLTVQQRKLTTKCEIKE